MNEKKVLGKGLSALIGDNFFNEQMSQDSKEENNYKDGDKIDLHLDSVCLNPYQPRKHFHDEDINDLVGSIKEHGVLQPVLVKHVGNGGFQLIAGERRYRACIKLGFQTMPAIVKNIDDGKLLEVALIENIQRENLDPIEEAKAISQLMNELGLTQEEVSKSIGKSRSYIANSLRLLSLSHEIQDLLSQKKITPGHARALIGRPNQQEILNKILNENLSVRQVEDFIKSKPRSSYYPSNKNNFFKDPADKDEALIDIEKGLSEALGMKVYIRETELGGQMTISFLSLDQLDTLIQKLSGVSLGF
jgi:ParB family transcriptional regulator, chromosome partitioning protein